MWGNRLGWGISAAIAIVVIGSLAMYVRQASTISPPTELGPQVIDAGPLALAMAPQTVLSSAGEDCDAGQLYSEAIALYRKSPGTYDGFAVSPRVGADAVTKLPAVQRLMEATKCSRMTLFAADPELVVRYGEVPEIDALVRVGKTAIRVGLAHKAAKRSDDAAKCYEAAFALGAKLFDERLTHRQLMAGLELMGEAGVGLSSLTLASGDKARSDAATKFEAARRELFKTRVQPVGAALISIDPKVVSRHAGDVFHIADHATERVWRVEAILSLGRMRFFVGQGGRIGDQRGASKRLKTYLNDNDPVIRAAAKAALDLTREQMRMLG